MPAINSFAGMARSYIPSPMHNQLLGWRRMPA
jgi:hypothetical protein